MLVQAQGEPCPQAASAHASEGFLVVLFLRWVGSSQHVSLAGLEWTV